MVLRINNCINTAQQCVDESEITAIMHPDSKFSSLDVKSIKLFQSHYWGIVNRIKVRKSISNLQTYNVGGRYHVIASDWECFDWNE